MKSIILPMMVIALLASAFTVVHEDLHQAMNKMMQKMKSMKRSGDADKDFAGMMAVHHEGAIDMSKIISKSGKDAKIKTIAERILSLQPQEQKDLKKHAGEDHGQGHSNHDANASSGSGSSGAAEAGGSGELHKIMQEMETKMKSMKMTGNLDHDYAAMMIDHHKDAIKMAEVETKHGKNQQVKELAEKIKTDSQKDIDELQAWLSKHGK